MPPFEVPIIIPSMEEVFCIMGMAQLTPILTALPIRRKMPGGIPSGTGSTAVSLLSDDSIQVFNVNVAKSFLRGYAGILMNIKHRFQAFENIKGCTIATKAK